MSGERRARRFKQHLYIISVELPGTVKLCLQGGRMLSRTLLTVLTVFSRDVRILITLLPARPSRLNVISMPSARRNVCARRKWPARARGFLGQPVLSPV